MRISQIIVLSGGAASGKTGKTLSRNFQGHSWGRLKMNIDPSTIVHFFCIGPSSWVNEYRQAGRQEWLSGFLNSTDFWKMQLGIEPILSQVLLGSYPEDANINLNLALHGLGIWSASNATSPSDLSIYFQVTTINNASGDGKQIVIGLAYRRKELKIDQAASDHLATYLPSDKAPAETPVATYFLYYSFLDFKQQNLDAARKRFFEHYPQLSADAFAGDVPGKFIKNFTADRSSGGYLVKQKLEDFKRSLPKCEPGGVILDHFHGADKWGRGIDQFVVYWGPLSAKTILALVPEATRAEGQQKRSNFLRQYLAAALGKFGRRPKTLGGF